MVRDIAHIRKEIEDDKSHVRDAERSLYEKKAQRAQVATRLESAHSEESRHSREVADFEEEVRDGVHLIGARVR